MEYTPEQIYNMLTSQRFADWYEGDFIDHIEGVDDCKDKEQILEDLKRILR